jgi:hypothetical protein
VKKIPTLFLRDPDDMRHVTRDVHPDCQWVIDGEGVATRKYDGTCVMFDGERWLARREVKPGKAAPTGYRPVETDAATGKTVGWEPIEQSAYAKVFARMMSPSSTPFMDRDDLDAGTYELIGPKINGNPEGVKHHELRKHAEAERLDAPRDYDGLAAFLAAFPGEGIVWHHSDGRMAKLKRRDFPGQVAA